MACGTTLAAKMAWFSSVSPPMTITYASLDLRIMRAAAKMDRKAAGDKDASTRASSMDEDLDADGDKDEGECDRKEAVHSQTEGAERDEIQDEEEDFLAKRKIECLVSLSTDTVSTADDHSDEQSILNDYSPREEETTFAAEHFVGHWKDSSGNLVQVHMSADEGSPSGMQVTAIMQKPPRRDIQMNVWQALGSEKSWRCGEALLDADLSSAKLLTWRFHDGRTSVWAWQRPERRQSGNSEALDSLLAEASQARMMHCQQQVMLPLWHLPTPETRASS
ncbi:unnamed protein product [Polarella glacialis]|uniref:Uncharacterized protein n=1 Tax=Polarella glacialis TaxID=89957 RepID=A0A813D6D8_POLGL|nr:unnamed protein product [Polarella glacialis]CAE8679562.1 unnamed protein product [Polarella glacialis]